MRDQFTYMGFTFVEQQDYAALPIDGEDVVYDIFLTTPYGPGDLVATARRDEVDPDAGPNWGIEVLTDPGTTHWFRNRLDAIKFIKENIG